MKEPVESEITETMGAEKELPSRTKPIWGYVSWKKVGVFIASLFLFIQAIILMKEGARALGPLVQNLFSVTNATNSLGFGWLFAYVVMSGSPVAAATLTFFDAGIIDKVSAFTMITGSRLGASFIVLFIGFIYVLRGRSRVNSLSMGLLSLLVTFSTYVAGLAVGLSLLRSGLLDAVQFRSGVLLNSVTELIFDPVANALQTFLPNWMIFLVGLGAILFSFSLFDKCLPEMTVKESQMGRVSRVVYRPWVMFLLGSAITLVSMSVSVSLGILVPLSQRGFIRRENVIPYIMGANITTFIDTLLAAVLLDNPAAFTVVFVEMFSIAIVSFLILAFVYRPYEKAILWLVRWFTESNLHMAVFMAGIVIIPLLLLFW